NEHSLSEASGPSAAPALDPPKVETVAAVGPQQHGMAVQEDRPPRQVPRDPAVRGGRWIPGRARLLDHDPGASGRRPEGGCSRLSGAGRAGYRWLPGPTVGPSLSATGSPGEHSSGCSVSTPARRPEPLLEAHRPWPGDRLPGLRS